jgi:hypothetical protein
MVDLPTLQPTKPLGNAWAHDRLLQPAHFIRPLADFLQTVYVARFLYRQDLIWARADHPDRASALPEQPSKQPTPVTTTRKRDAD